MKNIVLCCDGTANEFAPDRTNVVKLFSMLVHDDRQVAAYHPGLGTMEPPGALTPLARRFTRFLGRAVGYGLEDDVRDAYLFIMRNYEPGDRLFLFGFSRGAYTVRAVASLLRMYGLLRPGNEALVPYAIRLLVGINRQGRTPAGEGFELAREFKDTFSRGHVPIHFVGTWDTVSSVGWIGNPLRLPYSANNSDVAIARHAVSIDERRAFFRSNLWTPEGNDPEDRMRDVRQVWFSGVHCDVGGGYPEKESGLSKFALEWMVDEAVLNGLWIDEQKYATLMGRGSDDRYAAASVDAQQHNSLRGFWWLGELVPKPVRRTGRWRVNLGRRRRMPPRSLVHWSVIKRDPSRKGIPEDAIEVTRPMLQGKPDGPWAESEGGPGSCGG